jgi:16S rRNA (cytidine1402-2'-O)-methyltransferase
MTLNPGLYIIATPIGNLKDITLRALEVLQNVNYIICEDTRVSQKLLEKYNIKGKLMVYNDHCSENVRQQILVLIQNGNALALISDAGTPLICDPGYKLVRYLYDNNCYVDSLPGACSAIAALCLSALPSDKFLFLGFCPKSAQEQKDFFSQAALIAATTIFFETAPRLAACLATASQIMGGRKCAIVREITKMHQETIRGDLVSLAKELKGKELRGEIVVLIEKGEHSPIYEQIFQHVSNLKTQGFSSSDIAKILATVLKVNKKSIYKIAATLEN